MSGRQLCFGRAEERISMKQTMVTAAEYCWTGMIAHGGNEGHNGIRAGFCKGICKKYFGRVLYQKEGTV